VQSGESAASGGIRRSRIPTLGGYRVWNWTSLMCGCKGLMYWQWRPELLGPESLGFGLCNLDGSPTERTLSSNYSLIRRNSLLKLAKLVVGILMDPLE